ATDLGSCLSPLPALLMDQFHRSGPGVGLGGQFIDHLGSCLPHRCIYPAPPRLLAADVLTALRAYTVLLPNALDIIY
ncbi:MAG: hypothetical protein LC723_07490, partial [Actinobacteria bacterium]|nr:hypothetical protein [Actinomycetota bacterium]